MEQHSYQLSDFFSEKTKSQWNRSERNNNTMRIAFDIQEQCDMVGYSYWSPQAMFDSVA